MPRLDILCGLPFAGKSTLARELARQRGCQIIDHDVPDVLFARAVALLEEPGAGEVPLRYDGGEAVAAWVARLP